MQEVKVKPPALLAKEKIAESVEILITVNADMEMPCYSESELSKMYSAAHSLIDITKQF